MKIIKWVFIVMMLECFANAQGSKILEFQNTTKLKFAEYSLKSGPASCQEGPLSAYEVDDGFTLLLGNAGLIFAVGSKGETSQDGDCTSKYATTYDSKKIEGVITESCKDQPDKLYSVRVDIVAKGFTYRRSVIQNKKILFKETCRLVQK